MPAKTHATHAVPPLRKPPSAQDTRALGAWLDHAQAHCVAQGAQLTQQRREVLELLLQRKGSAKAYDLQEDMQVRHGRVAPTTVYRALEFLIAQRLVHKVDSTNTYVVCTGDHHPHPTMMVVCTHCGDISEWHDPAQFATLRDRVATLLPGFAASGLEIKGLCADCANQATDTH